MLVTQLSVFVENKAGRLAEITKVLGAHSIDIRAMSIADTTNFGILRLIVDEPLQAEEILRKEGFTVSQTKVIAVGINDKPGGLAGAMSALFDAGTTVEYMYAFVSRDKDMAYVIIRVPDNEKAIEILEKEGYSILTCKDIYKM